MRSSIKSNAKTTLHKASFFAEILCVFLLCACGLGPDPDADGARYNKRFYFYYVQDCRFDAIGTYDCGPIRSISPSIRVSLRIDSDGLASLNLEGDRYYYLESEYDEGYDPDYGGYFQFYNEGTQLVLFRDGWQMELWDNDSQTVTFYYYELL